MVNHALQKGKNTDLSFRPATVSQNLGNMFLDTFITKHYQDVNTDCYDDNVGEDAFPRSALDNSPNTLFIAYEVPF